MACGRSLCCLGIHHPLYLPLKLLLVPGVPGLQVTGSGLGVMTQQEDTGTDFLLDSNQGLGKAETIGP